MIYYVKKKHNELEKPCDDAFLKEIDNKATWMVEINTLDDLRAFIADNGQIVMDFSTITITGRREHENN